jgi:PTH1 family peptidyl-tRNA hydrolase
MKLIIGLGNIGKEYEETRHNIGFLCLDKFAVIHKLIFKTLKNYSFTKFKDCILLMPQTYMNGSGEAYRSALNKYKHFDEVLVILDDIDLPMGDIRIRTSGGSGGHNGLKSILDCADTLDILRIRIGIGRPDKGTPRKHVLDKFSPYERETIDKTLSILTDWLELYIRTDITRLLDEYSKWKKRPIPSTEGGINRPKEEPND